MSKTAAEIERDIAVSLRECSLAARGLWHELRPIMENESDRPGFLQRSERPLKLGRIAKLLGTPSQEVKLLLRELRIAGLVRATKEADQLLYYSPVLVRVINKRTHASGRTKRWRSHKGESRDPQKGVTFGARDAHVTPAPAPAPIPPPITPPITPTPTPLPPAREADAATIDRLEGWELAGIAGHLNTHEFRVAFAEWVLSRRDAGKRLPPITVRKQLEWLASRTLAVALAAIAHSIRNGYDGIHEPKESKGKYADPARAPKPTAAERGQFAHAPRDLPDF